MQTPVYVGLGSNLGDREKNLREALARMSALAANRISVSSFYVTNAKAMDDAPAFINAVATFRTSLTAAELLRALQMTEVGLGRPANHGENQSRTIDLDIIAFGDCRIDEPGLVVPHPRAHVRGFVLVPLAELAPALVLPGQSRTVQELANGIPAEERKTIISLESRHE